MYLRVGLSNCLMKEKKAPRFPTNFKIEGPIWKASKVYRLEAVKDVHVLDLSWTLPSLRQDYLKKSEDYLAHLLGHEGRGSLHTFFQAKGWVTSVSAGVGDYGLHRSCVAYIFGMSIHLTYSGLEKNLPKSGFLRNSRILGTWISDLQRICKCNSSYNNGEDPTWWSLNAFVGVIGRAEEAKFIGGVHLNDVRTVLQVRFVAAPHGDAVKRI